VSVLCGIGFTMSLFVANLAFGRVEDHLAASKIGILMASITSGVLGGTLIALAKRPVQPVPGAS
jgi:NhaA family Na+:H+ antiporter